MTDVMLRDMRVASADTGTGVDEVFNNVEQLLRGPEHRNPDLKD